MRSRLSRLLRITTSQQLRPTDFIEPQEGITFEDAIASESIGHDPQLTTRDDAIFLLHTIAEVEHALMIQYLFAAYSLKAANNPEEIPEDMGRLTPDQQTLVNKWQREIIIIATEEMGHLASVQNLLHLIGGSLNFEREDFPFRNGLYPFRFKLEPLTKNSLAKYVYAEMPEGLTGPDIDAIKRLAMGSNMNDSLIHVGQLFKALTNLFSELTEFAEDSEFLQADDIWKQGQDNLIIDTVKKPADALTLIDKIARQGEGLEDMTRSHYRRFRKIYDDFPEDDWQPSFNLAANPNTIPEEVMTDSETNADLQKELKEGSITNLKTRLWAQLLNARYRMLLIDISHALHLRINDEVESKRREILTTWAFIEMRLNIKRISRFLTLLPLREGNDAKKLRAGPPFELPYTLNLPFPEANRWRLHQDMIISSQKLTAKILADGAPDEDQKKYLEELAERDAKDLEQAKNPDANSGGEPEEPNMKRFSEVKNILENSVENSPIGEHGNFWRDKTRDEFVAFAVFGSIPLFAKRADGTFDENESNLIRALEGRAPFGSDIGTPGASMPRMPVGFDVVPQNKIDFIRNWIKDGCPDDGEVPPPPDASSFEADIKNLFRSVPDRQVMLFRFDLHKFEDVRDHADLILERLANKTMPCDVPWSDEKIEIFRKWMADGKNP